METNEPLQTTLVQQAEAEVKHLLKRVQDLSVGDLKAVEQEVLASVFQLGRRMLEESMQVQPETRQAPAWREGACGHTLRLVGLRPKQFLTLPGPITIERAYYHCQAGVKEPADDEQAQVAALWEQAAQSRTTPSSPTSLPEQRVDRLYSALDGVMAPSRS